MTVFQKVTRSLNHRKDKQGSRILNESESVYILKSVNDQTVERQGMDLLHSQYQALLEISEAIASHRDLDRLFHDLAPRLHRVRRIRRFWFWVKPARN
jgi:hypothetical protein